ncbi:MAG: hypothetical protein QXY35_03645 [Thermofilaceae archaeon]
MVAQRRFILTVLPLLLAVALAGARGQGVREVRVFNPLPYPRSEIIRLNLNFLEGEAYNGTLSIWDSSGNPVPLQLVNCTFYPSGHYKSCSLLFRADLPPLNVTRYFITYYSAPPGYNVSVHGGLSVRSANLTLVAFNATGSYAINVTNAIVVRGPGYTAIFSNSSLVNFLFDDVGSNLVFIDWPLAGFVAMRNLTIAASGYDLKECQVKLLLNGTLEAKVEQVCRRDGLELRQVFTFSGLSALVRVDAQLRGVGEGLLFFPFLRLAASDFREAVINETSVSVNRERSYVPAPRWLALRGGRGWLVVAVNYTSIDPKSVLEAQRLTLFRSYVNETHPLRKALYERLLRIHGNLTRVLTASQLAEAGKLNLTQTLREADYLSAFSSERDLLLKNLTDLLEASEKAASRLLFMPQEGTLNIAYQVGRREASISATIVLAVVAESPRDFVRFSLLSAVATPAVLYAPIEARLDAPTTVYVDDYLPVSAVVRSAEGLRNVSVRLVLPERAFAVVEGRRSVNFTLLQGTQRVDWTLRAVYEGSWPIFLNVSSPWGSLILERTINVSLLPIVPRVIIPRAFNVTIICIDAQGRPLSGYLVNLYENATGALVRWGFTNESGLLRFTNVTAGVYRIEVTDGFHSTWSTVYIYSDRNFTVSVGLSNLRVRVELAEGRPLPQAAVYVRDEEGSLVCAGFTDANGTVLCTGLPRGNYTVSLRWQGALAGSTRVSLTNDTEVVLRGLVRLVTVYVSLGGSPAAGAVVAAFSPGGTLIATTYTDERGIARLYLLPGPYRFTATKGQYSSSVTADVRVGGYVELNLTLSPSLWLLIAVTAALWSVTAYVWHRRTSYVYRERERYKRLLQRLEELYGRGEVEERFYVKLKQEYETKLNELSRGEWE